EEGRAVEEVVLARLEPGEAVGAERLSEDDGAGDDHRAALRLEAADAAALVDRQGGEAVELRLDGAGRQRVTVAERRVVLDGPEGERGEARDRPGDADRAVDVQLGQERADVCGGRVVVLAEALGQPHAADVEADVEVDRLAADNELGRAAADV